MAAITDPLVTNFTDLPVNDLIVTIRRAADKAETHIAFQESLPEYVSPSPKLRQIADGVGLARDAAYGNDRDRVAELKAQMAVGCQALTKNAAHIALLSMHRNDPSILLNAGYELKEKSASKGPVNLLNLVPEVFAKHAEGEGNIAILVKRAKQNASIELMMTDQDPNVEASWTTSLGIHNRSRIDLKGQEPARKIHIRARYHEDGATGRWSSIVSIIVL